MKSREHFKRRSMKFLLKSSSSCQNFYINLRGGRKFMRMSSIPSPQVINDPSLVGAKNHDAELTRTKRKIAIEKVMPIG